MKAVMTQELADYLNRVYWQLTTEEETRLLNKLHDYGNWKSLERVHGYEVAQGLLDRFELIMDEVDALSKVDLQQLYWDIATRIWNDHKGEIVINTCPVCGGVGRTAESRQCRKGHRW